MFARLQKYLFMNQESFNEVFRTRTKQSALIIIRLTAGLKYSDALGVIRKQLIKSATSVAANFRAVCRARSEREKYSKLCIVVEEADETLLWLEFLEEGVFYQQKRSLKFTTKAWKF